MICECGEEMIADGEGYLAPLEIGESVVNAWTQDYTCPVCGNLEEDRGEN